MAYEAKTNTKPLLVVKVLGGLGNQLFQLSTGVAAASRHRLNLALDTSWFASSIEHPHDTQRRPAFGLFFPSLREIGAVTEDSVELKTARGGEKGFRSQPDDVWFLDRAAYDSATSKPIIQNAKKPGVFNRSLTRKMSRGGVVAGYWQSPAYFSGLRQVILENLDDLIFTGSGYEPLMQEAEAIRPIGVHVRRGDYVTNPQIRNVHGVLPLDYYLEGIRLARAYLPGAPIWLFSDDLSFCQEWFPDGLVDKFVGASIEEPSDSRDLLLMSKCTGHVISNSTFGWWGAWLADSEIVFAPKHWTAQKHLNFKDLLPRHWQRLDSGIPRNI